MVVVVVVVMMMIVVDIGHRYTGNDFEVRLLQKSH